VDSSLETQNPDWSPKSDRADKLQVLVVEDDADSAQSMALLLRISGHEVRVALDGPTAIQMASDCVPDVILLDIGLPGMNGYETAQRVAQCCAWRRPLIVAVTGFGQETDRQHSAEAGIDLHLVKPVDPAYLQTLLKRFREIVKA
jgi:CheY-like chemotaxis protein